MKHKTGPSHQALLEVLEETFHPSAPAAAPAPPKNDLDETHAAVELFFPAPNATIQAKARLQLLAMETVYMRCQIKDIVSVAPHLAKSQQLKFPFDQTLVFRNVEEIEFAWGMACFNPGLTQHMSSNRDMLRALAGLLQRGGTLKGHARLAETTTKKAVRPTLWLNIRSNGLSIEPLS